MSKEQIEETILIVKNSIADNAVIVSEDDLVTLDGNDFDHAAAETAEALYNAGYRKQSEWISVDDETPKNQMARVLVFLLAEEATNSIGFPKIDTDRYVNGKWVRWGRFVTHWMPLPEAPSKKVEAKPFFSPEQVRKMSQKEVHKNYQAILDSMKEWK